MQLLGGDPKQTAYVFARFAVAVVVPFDAVFSRLCVPLKRRVGGTTGAAIATSRNNREAFIAALMQIELLGKPVKKKVGRVDDGRWEEERQSSSPWSRGQKSRL